MLPLRCDLLTGTVAVEVDQHGKPAPVVVRELPEGRQPCPLCGIVDRWSSSDALAAAGRQMPSSRTPAAMSWSRRAWPVGPRPPWASMMASSRTQRVPSGTQRLTTASNRSGATEP